MKKIKIKLALITFLAVFAFLCLGAIFITPNKDKALAEKAPAQENFVMEKGAAFRHYWTVPNCGITFTAKMAGSASGNSVRNVKLFIAPYDFITDINNSDNETAKGFIESGEYIKAFDVYNDGKEDKDKKNYVLVPPSVVNINGEYVFKGGIKTIKDDNLNRKFFGIYFYEQNGTEYYAGVSCVEDTSRSMAYVSSASYENLDYYNEDSKNNLLTYMDKAVKTAVKRTGEQNVNYDSVNANNLTVELLSNNITFLQDVITTTKEVIANVKDTSGQEKEVDITSRLDFAISWKIDTTWLKNRSKATYVETLFGGPLGGDASVTTTAEEARFGTLVLTNQSVTINKVDLNSLNYSLPDYEYIGLLNTQNANELIDTYTEKDLLRNAKILIPNSYYTIGEKLVEIPSEYLTYSTHLTNYDGQIKVDINGTDSMLSGEKSVYFDVTRKQFAITATSTDSGDIEFSKYTAYYGDTVDFTVKPNQDMLEQNPTGTFALSSIKLLKENSSVNVQTEINDTSFIMPAYNVVGEVAYENTLVKDTTKNDYYSHKIVSNDICALEVNDFTSFDAVDFNLDTGVNNSSVLKGNKLNPLDFYDYKPLYYEHYKLGEAHVDNRGAKTIAVTQMPNFSSDLISMVDIGNGVAESCEMSRVGWFSDYHFKLTNNSATLQAERNGISVKREDFIQRDNSNNIISERDASFNFDITINSKTKVIRVFTGVWHSRNITSLKIGDIVSVQDFSKSNGSYGQVVDFYVNLDLAENETVIAQLKIRDWALESENIIDGNSTLCAIAVLGENEGNVNVIMPQDVNGQEYNLKNLSEKYDTLYSKRFDNATGEGDNMRIIFDEDDGFNSFYGDKTGFNSYGAWLYEQEVGESLPVKNNNALFSVEGFSFKINAPAHAKSIVIFTGAWQAVSIVSLLQENTLLSKSEPIISKIEYGGPGSSKFVMVEFPLPDNSEPTTYSVAISCYKYIDAFYIGYDNAQQKNLYSGYNVTLAGVAVLG